MKIKDVRIAYFSKKVLLITETEKLIFKYGQNISESIIVELRQLSTTQRTDWLSSRAALALEKLCQQ